MRDIINNTMQMNSGAPTALRYEQLKQWEVGKAVIKDAVNRWSSIGFLDFVEDEIKKETMAVAFDNMAHDLLKEDERVVKIEKRYNFNCTPDDETEQGTQFDVIVFPIIRRVIKKTDNFTYEKFLTALEKLSFLAINYDDYHFDCDIEAEYCAIISTVIEEMFNNEKNSK